MNPSSYGPVASADGQRDGGPELKAPRKPYLLNLLHLRSSVEENTPIRTPDIPTYEGKTGTVREGDEDPGLAARMVFPFPM